MTGPGRARWVVLATLSLAVLMVAIDATVLNLAIPEITRDLDPTSTQLLWILDVYSLVLAGLLVSAGTLSDRLGRKRVLLAGCSLFAVASVLAAFAPTAEALIAARVLLGIGGATIMPSTLAIIRNVFTDRRERTLAIGVWSAMAAAGAAVGPIVGGVLLEHFWWGSVFLINVPVMAVLLVAGVIVIPALPGIATGRWDWPSAVASMVGLVTLVLAIKTLAHDGLVATFWLYTSVALLVLGWFVRRQVRIPVPLIDVTLFKRRSFSGAVLANLLSLSALAGLLLFLSQHLQLVLSFSPLEAGIRMLPLTLGALVGAPLTATLARRLGTAHTITLGLALGTLGLTAFAATVDANYVFLALSLVGVGAGVGVSLTATSDAILNAAPADHAGAASSISETAYELGTGLGIAIFGSILAALYASNVATVPYLDTAASQSLAAAIEQATALPEASVTIALEGARVAFDTALTTTALIAASLLAITTVVSRLLLRPQPG
ncbi:MAG: MFS transporter [Actinobacteria bacterium]|nr:MFS transporter [Actinomycetota bacterium]